MLQTDIKEPAKNLGFKKIESAEISKQLNTVLATYQIFYHKLQNFHWNVVGADFFDIHDLTQEMYERAVDDIDEIAERVRVMGQVPMYRMNDYIENSLIKESQYDLSAEFMVRHLIGDIEALIESFIGLHEASTRNGDLGGALMASQMVKKFETNHWQLSAWCDKKFKLS